MNQTKIEEAVAAIQEAIEKKLPNASVSGAYMQLSHANIEMKKQSNTGNGNGNGGGQEQPKISQALYGMLNVSMPIYNGGKIKYGIENSRYLAEAVKLDADLDKEKLIQITIESFADLFKANSAINLMNENLEAAQQRVKELSHLEKNGLLARNDLLKAQLQVSNIELSLSDATNNFQLANLNLDLMLGLPITTELRLDTTGIEKMDDGTKVLADYLQDARHNRKDIFALDFRKKAAENGVLIAKAEKYPGLQLTGGYIAADIPKFLTVTNALNIGLGVSYNISSLWKSKAKIQQAESKARSMTIASSALEDNITIQVSKAYLTLMNNRRKIEVNEMALEQAKENYRIVKNKFDNSLATTTELLDADVAHFQANLKYTLSRADAFVAYTHLLQTTGMLAADFIK